MSTSAFEASVLCLLEKRWVLSWPEFGTMNPALAYTPRRAAYVVILDAERRVAAVKGKRHYFLPGGGSLPDETPEQTVVRETREELARELGNLRQIGQAVQYFFADETHYRMEAVFFAAEFAGEATGEGEHRLEWLDAEQVVTGFFHQCHVWAINQLNNGEDETCDYPK
ncbi:MAG: NUDIX domain-containing protein [Blastocatellia bacterium]